MPLRLNVGLSQKIGQPDYGSLGASCNVELELDGGLLQHDLEAFHRHVRNAFVACRQAVQDELSSKQAANPAANYNGGGSASQTAPANRTNGYSNNRQNGQSHGSAPAQRTGSNSRSSARRATASQVRALLAIADRQEFDLSALLSQRFDFADPCDLTITQASQLIDELNTVGQSARGAA